jgi:transposase
MNTKQDARKLDLIGKEDLRRRTVRAVLQQGLSKTEVARIFGVSRTSVHWWIELYEKHGEDGLTPKLPGRPKCGGRLKGWQAATIVNIIKDHCPDQLKMPFALWTREAVRDLMHMRFGIRYSLGMVGRLLRRWGFTPQKPVTRA